MLPKFLLIALMSTGLLLGCGAATPAPSSRRMAAW